MLKKWLLGSGSILLLGVAMVTGQTVCPVEDTVVAAALEACADLADNTVCDTAAETTASLAETETIQTEGGVAVAAVRHSDDATLRVVLYGDATLTNTVQTLTAESPVLELRNAAGYPLNLRAGPGTSFAETGAFAENAVATADGRSADSQWVRLQTDASLSWVRANLVSIDGDISALPVVDSRYARPYQAMRLQTSVEAPCSGVLFQAGEGETVNFGLNGADVTLMDATVAVSASVETGLTLNVLVGEAAVTAQATRQVLRAGEGAVVRLNDALEAAERPRFVQQYAFASVQAAPLSLLPLPASNLCITGVPLSAQARETRGGPGEAYSALAPLDVSLHYEVAGYATAPDGTTWLKLANGRWTPALGDDLVGMCSSYVEVDAPPLGQTLSVPSNISYAPASNTRYQAYSGNDVLSGQCSTAPLAVCDHLAVVIPNPDGTMGWRGQEPITYTLTPQGGNRYYYTGRNFQNNANLTLDLTFTANGWTMTMSTVYDSDPTCTHTFYYTAQKL
jgi:uncharacterized protein YraI